MALANFYPIIPAYDEDNCARFGDTPGPDGRGNCVDGWNIEYSAPHGDVGFTDSALFEVLVTVPAGWTVVSSGSTVGREAEPDGAVTWRLVGGPIRDFNMVLSPRFDHLWGTFEDIVINSYYLPEDATGGKRALNWAIDALTLFSQRFGPYPLAEFDIVATPNVAGGIEYPGLIVMPIRNYDLEAGFFQLATVHEVAHQWWYSLVGNDQQDEPWLDEGLAQYSTALYFEVYEGWEAAGAELFGPWYDRVRGTALDGAIDMPVAEYEQNLYSALVYGKGPLFFHALRQELGDEAFFALLQAYFESYRYGIASGPDLLALVDGVSGRDLRALYQEWLTYPQ
jgi:aminopeptidase N